jgi:hypothetical protein
MTAGPSVGTVDQDWAGLKSQALRADRKRHLIPLDRDYWRVLNPVYYRSLDGPNRSGSFGMLKGWRGIVVVAFSITLFWWAIGYAPNQELDKGSRGEAQEFFVDLTSAASLTCIFTAVLAGVGVFTWLTFNRQAGIMDATLKQMQRDAADRSTEFNCQFELIARNAISAEAMERAYVFVGPLKVEATGASDEMRTGTRVFLVAQNFGKTPAIIKAVHAEVADVLPESAIYTKEPKWPQDYVLGAGQREPAPDEPDETGLYFWSKSPNVQYFFGYVKYTDIFKKLRTSRFCVQLHPQLNAFVALHERPDLTDFD